jgi:hypothetical protein
MLLSRAPTAAKTEPKAASPTAPALSVPRLSSAGLAAQGFGLAREGFELWRLSGDDPEDDAKDTSLSDGRRVSMLGVQFSAVLAVIAPVWPIMELVGIAACSRANSACSTASTIWSKRGAQISRTSSLEIPACGAAGAATAATGGPMAASFSSRWEGACCRERKGKGGTEAPMLSTSLQSLTWGKKQGA